MCSNLIHKPGSRFFHSDHIKLFREHSIVLAPTERADAASSPGNRAALRRPRADDSWASESLSHDSLKGGKPEEGETAGGGTLAGEATPGRTRCSDAKCSSSDSPRQRQQWGKHLQIVFTISIHGGRYSWHSRRQQYQRLPNCDDRISDRPVLGDGSSYDHGISGRQQRNQPGGILRGLEPAGDRQRQPVQL